MKNSLARPLADTDSPVFALDPRRAIVFCNAALAKWLEVDASQLLGQRCDYSSSELSDPYEIALATLATPPEVFSGSQATGIVCRPLEGGAVVRRRVRYSLLPQGDENWVVGVVDPTDLGGDVGTDDEAPANELHRELMTLRTQIRRRYRADRLLGDSPTARRVREQVRIAIDSGARTMIVGPPGSGREHLARAIHGGAQESERQPLLPLTCSLLDSDLLEAAVHAFVRQSAREDAPPTVLLLEADQLTAESQEALARLLFGSRRPVRTLTTARRSLLQLAAEGLLRTDLADWLSPLVIELPPLAARRQDIPVLAQLALEEFNATSEQQLSGFQPDALQALVAYGWPENFDELHAVLSEACRKSAGPLVALGDLSDVIRRAAEPVRPARADEPIELDKFLADIEREVIVRALRRSKGNKAQAARMLGVPRVRLLRRIEQLGIP